MVDTAGTAVSGNSIISGNNLSSYQIHQELASLERNIIYKNKKKIKKIKKIKQK